MMTEREIGVKGSLFERVSDAAMPLRYSCSHSQLLQSINRNLENILNTRSGSCFGSPALGIPDLNDDVLISSDFREEICRGIKDCILHYEPRLCEIVVTAGFPEETVRLELGFHIVAQMNIYNINDFLEFDILLDNRQRYRVR